MKRVIKHCRNEICNQTACCTASESYFSLLHLQKQSFITNLQASNCATSLGKKLRKSNITIDMHSLPYKPQRFLTPRFALAFNFIFLIHDHPTSIALRLKMSSLMFPSSFSVTEVGCLLLSLPSDATFNIFRHQLRL